MPEDLQRQHKQWRSELHLLAAVRLPRYYFHHKKKPTSISLHGFCDASQEAYAATVYMRATYSSGPPTSNLVISKTRVAPLKSRTIPQLELCGAHLLAKLLTSTSQTLDIPLENITNQHNQSHPTKCLETCSYSAESCRLCLQGNNSTRTHSSSTLVAWTTPVAARTTQLPNSTCCFQDQTTSRDGSKTTTTTMQSHFNTSC